MTDDKSTKKPDCTHFGHWKSAGTLNMPTSKGVSVFIFLYCENCGALKTQVFPIQAIAIPKTSNLPNMRKN